ncbi:MAG TPA: hypothetical protein VH914_18970 [Acidimicrobiia bacterium]|jgi:hypothetical protein|nr:hypothetical protein [Acidimicrobiia bacterium]
MSTIASKNQRTSDVKLLAIVTAIVVLGGFFIAGSILFLSRGGKTGPCGRVNGGSLTDLVPRAATAPSYVAVSGGCRYWLALRNGRLVAIKPTVASTGCTVDWKPSNDEWTCDGRQVTLGQLDFYKTAVGTGDFKGSWIIDFGDEGSVTTVA